MYSYAIARTTRSKARRRAVSLTPFRSRVPDSLDKSQSSVSLDASQRKFCGTEFISTSIRLSCKYINVDAGSTKLPWEGQRSQQLLEFLSESEPPALEYRERQDLSYH